MHRDKVGERRALFSLRIWADRPQCEEFVGRRTVCGKPAYEKKAGHWRCEVHGGAGPTIPMPELNGQPSLLAVYGAPRPTAEDLVSRRYKNGSLQRKEERDAPTFDAETTPPT